MDLLAGRAYLKLRGLEMRQGWLGT